MTESHSSFTAARTIGLPGGRSGGVPGRAPVLFLCEHASNDFPADFDTGEVPGTIRDSHVAWDPGALPLAERLAAGFAAPLVAGGVSRLLYDCNRPPDASDAIPERSEIFDIPFNRGLSGAQRARRVSDIYDPFREAVETALNRAQPQALVTVHSFTRVYAGVPRDVEIGVLHDRDTRLADALLASLSGDAFTVRRNEPYGPEHGVTHSLRQYALPRGLPNVMLEIRNDLLRDAAAQEAMAACLTPALRAALEHLGITCGDGQ